MTGPRPPVVVLLGGPSAEHDVSVVSGTAIADALADAGYDVEQVVIDLDGAWWWLPAGHRRGGSAGDRLRRPGGARRAGPAAGRGRPRPARRRAARAGRVIALHGPFGEDGTVQALLDAAGLAYTGSGVAASAIGMDKALFKRMMPRHRPAGRRLARGPGRPLGGGPRRRPDRAGRVRRRHRRPAPDGQAGRLGSSVGMTLVHDTGELAGALDLAFRYDTLALVEAYLRGRPRPRGLGHRQRPARLELYGPGEIVSGHEFYDYAAKYTPGLSESAIRAEVTEPTQRATMQKIARDAYRAIGAEGFARVDFLLAGDAIYLSEINTIPGFTPISLFPTMPAEGGYTFAAVCVRIVELAIERHAARGGRRLTPADLPR